jgi:glycosyltransferase involved in cell wall biosynthesis
MIVAPWARPLGGAERMLSHLVAVAPECGVAVSLVFLEDGAMVETAAESADSVEVVPATRLRDPINATGVVHQLNRIFRRRRPDVVISWMAKSHLYTAPAAKIARIPDARLWWVQHLVPTGEWLDRVATSLPTGRVLACSVTAANAQAQLRPSRPVDVLRPGIPDEGRDMSAATRIRHQFGIGDDAVVVGIVGRLQPWKGQHLAISAVAALISEGRDVHLIVVGGTVFGRSAGYGNELTSLVAELGIVERVHFAGHVNEAAAYFDAFDIAVNGSDGEPFGMVILEAMRASVPVVAIDKGGPSEILTSGRDGVLVPRASIDCLADGMRDLVSDEALRRRLAAEGRRTYEDRHSDRRMGEAFSALIKEEVELPATQMRRIGIRRR